MATMMDQSEVTAVGRTRPRATRPSPLPLTLYDLITAIQDVVGPADDELVVATVRHLLHCGRLTGGPELGGVHRRARRGEGAHDVCVRGVSVCKAWHGGSATFVRRRDRPKRRQSRRRVGSDIPTTPLTGKLLTE
jgi:hypothetical protein